MKIHSTHQNIGDNWRINRQMHCLLSFCGALALCILTSNNVAAQSRGLATLPALLTDSSNMVRNGLFVSGDESYQVVNTAAYRTAADIGTAEAGSIAQVGYYGGCDSCGTACGGSCDGFYSPYIKNGNACAPCNPYCYAIFEGLHVERDADRRMSLSPDFDMNGFDFESAGRITIGSVSDCVHGCELSFTSPLKWSMAGAATDPGFGLGTLLVPGLPVDPADLSAFSDADLQFQTYTAEYWSLEVNRVLIGWDISKLLAGVRYISYEERYAYYSQNLSEAGLLLSDLDNQLFGLHIGADLIYPISKHAYLDFRTRLGGFINFAESDIILDNAGNHILRTGDDDDEFAIAFELGG